MSDLWRRLAFARVSFATFGLMLLVYRAISGTGPGENIHSLALIPMLLGTVVFASFFATEPTP